MSAPQVCDKLVEAIKSGKYDVVIINFANPDMVGHTGVEDAAIKAILEGLEWLGIQWDDQTIYQFARAARHREVAEQLLADGKAYRCYASAEELAQMREAARAEGRAIRYDGRWRDRDPSEAPAGVKPVIRLRAPQTGETVIEDQVQGRVVWQNENLDDLVLLRGDGNPTYMLAVVVDDHDMGVDRKSVV